MPVTQPDQTQDPRWAVQREGTAVQRHPLPAERKGAGMGDGKPAADSRISNDHKAPC
jgi:hypothetical protein